MLVFNKDSKVMKIVAKDTADFVVALDNYLLDTGDEVLFTVNNELEKEEYILQKRITEFSDHKALIHLTPTDTDIAPSDYYYDIQINTADGRVDTVIGPAKFKVVGGVSY